MDGLIATTGRSWTVRSEEKVALVVDEWGAWYAQLPGSTPGFLAQQNSLRDAILAALNLNIFARHADRVRMANIAQMINVLQAMILTDKEKMVLTPTYHVFRMYVPFQDATVVPVAFDAGVHAWRHHAAARRCDRRERCAGTLWLALTNLDPMRPVDIATRLAADRPVGHRRNADRAGGRQRQHLRRAEDVPPKLSRRRSRAIRSRVTLQPKSVTVLALRPDADGFPPLRRLPEGDAGQLDDLDDAIPLYIGTR